MGSAGGDPHCSVEQCCRGTFPTAVLFFLLFFFFNPLSPLSTAAVLIRVPSTAAESGTTAIVTVNQSLVLTAFCLDFYHFGRGCSKLNTPNDCIILYQLIFVCVLGLYN